MHIWNILANMSSVHLATKISQDLESDDMVKSAKVKKNVCICDICWYWGRSINRVKKHQAEEHSNAMAENPTVNTVTYLISNSRIKKHVDVYQLYCNKQPTNWIIIYNSNCSTQKILQYYILICSLLFKM